MCRVAPYLVLNGYLRHIGQYVHQLQRSVNEVEELVQVHDESLGVIGRADARPMAIVPQAPVRFHHTLAENIGNGRFDATQAEIEQAGRHANAHDFIAALPKSYRTLVGERGVKLSGGERQRVAIARAFLADAPVLILDEAASNLDSESEASIQQALERLMVGRTAIVIAHRLSTVRSLDRILGRPDRGGRTA